jgi:hypothetical protein
LFINILQTQHAPNEEVAVDWLGKEDDDNNENDYVDDIHFAYRKPS